MWSVYYLPWIFFNFIKLQDTIIVLYAVQLKLWLLKVSGTFISTLFLTQRNNLLYLQEGIHTNSFIILELTAQHPLITPDLWIFIALLFYMEAYKPRKSKQDI